MTSIILIALVCLATLENLWPLIAGYTNTPKGMIFLGTVHHPADYFYYLSQFAQGANHTLTTIDLYTSERLPPTIVGWSNVLLGKLFFLFNIPPVFAYHISVCILTVLLFFAAYVLSLNVLKSRYFAVLSLYLFTLFHAFPVMREGKPSYGDYWNNFAVPRVRIGAVPHQLLIAISSFLLVLGIFQWTQNNHSRKSLLLVICSSIILGSLQPVLWALITGMACFSYIVSIWKTKRIFVPTLLQGAVAMGSGVIPFVYLTGLFRTLPFSQLRMWEATQQTSLTLEHFLTATGPVFLIALVSIPIVLKRITFERVFLVVFTMVSYTFLLSPLPRYVGISHVRFMSTLTILSSSLLASYGLLPLLQAKRRWLTWTAYTLIAMLTALLVPNHFKTIELSSSFDVHNRFEYLPSEEYRFLGSIAPMSKNTDTFLVIPPYDELFPAISGRKSYSGHPLLTVNQAEKQALSASFFANSWDSETMHRFLQKNSIQWVISTPNHITLHTASWASIRAKTTNLVLYAIQN